MPSYGCQQILIIPDLKLKAVLEFVCQESNKLANCAIYYCRQLYLKTGQIAHRYDLNKLLKTNPHFKALYSHVGQATLTSVAESFQSFKALRKLSFSGKLDQRPRLPNYRTEKRNRQVRDAVNKAARLIINHCLDNQIKTIVFGWNKGQKDSANMGAKTNQKFVQIPTGRLKDRIAQLAETYGIKFVETEESYTSKASFVDLDVLPTIGAKPDGWQQSGKRVKRGLYRTANNQYINADCNGLCRLK
ncbi:IS200/IS605 family accessory protein TnpB-related protein [Chamaesiphon sp.]|uniref:IS200/IS605 family accessory protein TnpB-related protein n=1 Tax=Chamaesiphon sp. TaxID=2814140 RepID=UPI003592F709